MAEDVPIKERKVMTIGIVQELTGLTVRKIRYYEERGLIFPVRTTTGNRKYSFEDVETLIDIANQREEGVTTIEIKEQLARKHLTRTEKRQLLKEQIHAHFRP